jgi:hypothetical protein
LVVAVVAHIARRVVLESRVLIIRIIGPGGQLQIGVRGDGWMRFVVSPVPKGEGPGAPSVWFGNLTGTVATRPSFHGVVGISSCRRQRLLLSITCPSVSTGSVA